MALNLDAIKAKLNQLNKADDKKQNLWKPEADLDAEFAKRGINARFESQFNDESELNENTIHIPNLSWQDQTRIVKWLGQQDYGRKNYKVIEKGNDIVIDTFGLDQFEIEEIKSYLKSQNYKFSINV